MEIFVKSLDLNYRYEFIDFFNAYNQMLIKLVWINLFERK